MFDRVCLDGGYREVLLVCRSDTSLMFQSHHLPLLLLFYVGKRGKSACGVKLSFHCRVLLSLVSGTFPIFVSC